MGKRVAGTCYIKVDGTQLEVKGSVEVPLTDRKLEAVVGLNAVAGYKEEVRTPYVKLSAIFKDDFPRDTLQKGTEMTVTVELPNGKVYTLSDAFLVGEPAVKADEGETELEFNGMKGEWQ